MRVLASTVQLLASSDPTVANGRHGDDCPPHALRDADKARVSILQSTVSASCHVHHGLSRAHLLAVEEGGSEKDRRYQRHHEKQYKLLRRVRDAEDHVLQVRRVMT